MPTTDLGRSRAGLKAGRRMVTQKRPDETVRGACSPVTVSAPKRFAAGRWLTSRDEGVTKVPGEDARIRVAPHEAPSIQDLRAADRLDCGACAGRSNGPRANDGGGASGRGGICSGNRTRHLHAGRAQAYHARRSWLERRSVSPGIRHALSDLPRGAESGCRAIAGDGSRRSPRHSCGVRRRGKDASAIVPFR